MNIKISNLTFSYDTQNVLENINLSYDCKDFLAITGPNGGGKTTLLKLIMGILRPKSGTICFNFGENLSQNSQNFAKISKLIGYVPQTIPQNQIFPMSVLDVVLMGRCNEKKFFFYTKNDKEIAMDALKKVSMQNKAKCQIGALSGGERQRVYIARAVCANAKILMLDEPLASIDAKGSVEIYEILKALNAQNIGILMISHDINMAMSFATKIAYINRELYLHDISGENGEEFLEHLAKNHSHFCDVEILSKKCNCETCPKFAANHHS